MPVRRIGGPRRSLRVVRSAAVFTLDPLERRILFCTLDGTHIPELHPIESTEAEPNDSLATANPFGATDTLNGTIASSGDLDYWVTTLAQGDRMRLRPGTDPGQRHYKPRTEILSSTGSVLMTSADGHELNFYAPSAGQYYVRLGSAARFGTFTGSYGTEGGANLISATVTPFTGTSESEPNDSSATADPLSSSRTFRGSLATSAESDYFSASLGGGQVIAIKFTSPTGSSPSVRLFDPLSNLVASDLTGAGLHFIAPSSGTYTFQVAGDNTSGAVSGDYVGSMMVGAGPVVGESEPANNSFDGAVPFTLQTSNTRLAGSLGSSTDLDLFRFDFVAGRSYTFTIDASSELVPRAGRQLSLFNEFGQLMEVSYTGSLATNAATGFGFRIEHGGRHYLAVSAIDPTGLGGYIVSAAQTSTFPTQRDVPLIFQDYTGQRTHLGYGPAAALLNPASIPAMLGMYEARYDAYDVDLTTTYPGAVSFVGFGAGEFGSIGAYGYGGSFSLGSRRISGDSVLDDSGSTFTNLANIRTPASVMNQETGHASGLYAHARDPLAFMAYDNQSALDSIGTYYPFPWTDSRVPDVESRNQREFLDWVMQAGRIADEAEPNDSSGTAMSLAGFMSEMTGDSDPRNDRVALAGRINSSTDVDFYSFTASAGQKFAFDVDAAEFQHPLDATLQLLDGAGNVLATSFDALDRDSGLDSVDPYLVHTFASAGTYRLRVLGQNGTFGSYRLKLTSGAAFETAGPRVIASWPNGGTSVDGTRQLVFWLNDKLDPNRLTSNNIVVERAGGGVVSGQAVFDPTDSVLIWRADSQLVPGSYTVTLRSGAGGLTDLRGNTLDGETDGTMSFPEISGNGTAGGNFTTTFTITTPDNSPASVSTSSSRRHPYNRVLLTVTLNDDLDIRSALTSDLRLRCAGTDLAFNTGDDSFAPIDVSYDKIKMTSGSKVLEVYTRGVPGFGSYRLEGSLLDAAGNAVNLSTSFAFNSSTLSSGPSIADVSIRQGRAQTAATERLVVSFSAPLDVATLNTTSFVLRRSADATFFDGNDTIVSDADGVIDWDPVNLTATFAPGGNLADGYYLLELDGDSGGITAPGGALIDGDWLDTDISGNSLFSHWHATPSGDGFAGGDYRAMFTVKQDTTGPAVDASAFVYQDYPQRLVFTFSEDVSGSLSTSDFIIENLTSGNTLSPALMQLAFDTSSNTATLSFPGLPQGILPNGDYRATVLAAGVTDRAGNSLAGGDYQLGFYFYQGDADHNGVIDFDDYALIDLGFNSGLTGFGYGDFNYDGVIDFDDYVIIDLAFNTQ